METRVTSIEATARFAELLKRVREAGESFVIEEAGRPVCTVRPADENARTATFADLAAWLQNGPHVDEEYLEIVEDHIAEMNKPVAPESPWDR